MFSPNQQKQLTIVGGGIVGNFEAYYAWKEAQENGIPIHIRILEQNKDLLKTTSANISPSFTPDEILSVVPRGKKLIEKLGKKFNESGGIRVDDVKGVDNEAAANFKREAKEDSENEEGYKARTQALLELGKSSMDSWKEFYDQADDELKQILIDSNYNPCCELKDGEPLSLHKGYRIDLINIEDAKKEAEAMKDTYQQLGYKHCEILSPKQAVKLDSSLADFCESHSVNNEWKNDAVTLYRPGGCLNAQVFLPKFQEYLKKKMGNCFEVQFDKEVTGVVYHEHHQRLIRGLLVGESKTLECDNSKFKKSEYVFCPGEAVGTLKKLGFAEPAHAGFAGASLKLNIPVPRNYPMEKLQQLNNCMEVHRPGVVLAWQTQFRNDKIFIGVAGTKSFYSDLKPDKNQEFAKNRNLLQLNMINDVYPEYISIALSTRYPEGTKGITLADEDLKYLEEQNVIVATTPTQQATEEKHTAHETVAKRWVGRRAVAFDGFPTLGAVWNHAGKVLNARCTTHLGSGGVSFVHSTVNASRSLTQEDEDRSKLNKLALQYGSSRRTAQSDAELARKKNALIWGFAGITAFTVFAKVASIFSRSTPANSYQPTTTSLR